jgi:clan AA aspartic protease (TIGR02281 family)
MNTRRKFSFTFAASFLLLSLGLPVVSAQPPAPVTVDQLEQLMDRYFRKTELLRERAALKSAVEAYNAWGKSVVAQQEESQAQLEDRYTQLKALEKQITAMDKRLNTRPNRENQSAVQAYQNTMQQRNELVRRYNKLVAQTKELQTQSRQFAAKAKKEMARRQADLGEQQQSLKDLAAQLQAWFDKGNHLVFQRKLNQTFAALRCHLAADDTPHRRDQFKRLRAMRRTLFEQLKERQANSEAGMVVVQAQLCGSEPCYFLVDTGASRVTISPALVTALGLDNQVGEEIPVTVAGGTRVAGRSIEIPKIAVHGVEARNVKAVVLNESVLGADGLLGMSFLNRFRFHFDRSHADHLILEPLEEKVEN